MLELQFYREELFFPLIQIFPWEWLPVEFRKKFSLNTTRFCTEIGSIWCSLFWGTISNLMTKTKGFISQGKIGSFGYQLNISVKNVRYVIHVRTEFLLWFKNWELHFWLEIQNFCPVVPLRYGKLVQSRAAKKQTSGKRQTLASGFSVIVSRRMTSVWFLIRSSMSSGVFHLIFFENTKIPAGSHRR